MENRNGPIVDARLTEANGTEERLRTALDMIEDNAGPAAPWARQELRNRDFVAGCRERGCTPHVSQNMPPPSAIDARTPAIPAIASARSAQADRRTFGWMKTVGGLRKTGIVGAALVEWFSS